MLRKFINWWRKITHESRDGGNVDSDQKFREEKFETTLVRDLIVISDLLGKEFPRQFIDNDWNSKSEGRVAFRSEGYSIRNIKKEVDLKSFRVDQDYSNINIVYWSVNKDEYKAIYESKYIRYANNVRELLTIVEKEFDNPDYFYTFCKYEDSIHIVANTLKDEHGNNSEEVGVEVFEKSRIIIDKLATAIMKKRKELKYIEELQQEAISKSLINRLDNEIEFIDKYLEVN